MDAKGRYFFSQSSAAYDCTLLVKNVHLRFLGPEGEDFGAHHLGDVKFEPQVGSIPRKIKLPNGDVFETDEFDTIAALEGRGFWSRLTRVERVGWHLVPIAIATPILAIGFYRLLVPVFIYAAMALTPDAALYTIDTNSMRSLDRFFTQPTEIDQARQDAIQTMFSELVESRKNLNERRLTDREFKYNLQFRSGMLGPNAFALPGGTIVLTDELVKDYGQDHVISAVLAHEIGHLEGQHSLRRLYRALGMATMISVVAGDAGPILEDALLEGTAILSLSFSRTHELEADNFSYDLLTASGLPNHGLIDFFEQLGEDMPLPEEGEWLKTHPLSSKRIDNIRGKIDAER